MKIKHLDHLNMSVANLSESIQWYSRVLGFALVEDGVRNGVNWAIIRSGEAMLCLYEHTDWSPPNSILMTPPPTEKEDHQIVKGTHGLNHFGLRIVDRQAWEQTLISENIEVLYGGPVEWPHSTAWYVVDPTGYEIEVALWKNDCIEF